MFGKKKAPDPSTEWTKTGSFMHKPSRGWLHSDNSLMEGGVCYAVRYVGCLQVLKSMRTLQYDMRQQVTREAILRCSEVAGYHLGKRKKAGKNVQKLLAEFPSMSDSGVSVNMTVSSAGIKLASIENGKVITNHDMQGISFASGGEKDCVDMIGYVAKDQVNGRACFVVDCGGGLAYDVINTIGQAFEIRFKMFLQNPPLATEVPERFSDTIFECEEHTYELEYEEPKDDARQIHVQPPHIYHSANSVSPGYMALRTTTASGPNDYGNPYKGPPGHGYDVPKATHNFTGYEAPNRQTNTHNPGNGVSGVYDNPTELMGPSSNRNGLSYADSLKFAAGPCFENPNNSAFFENPLGTPLVPHRSDSLDQHPLTGVKESPYDNPSSPQSSSGQDGWATFDDDIAPPPRPPMSTNPGGGQDVLKPRPAPRQRPPVPKPYAATRSEKDQQAVTTTVTPAATESESSGPIPLESEVWYHGPMSRAEAELLLEDEGDFLVRESKSKAGQYVLSGVQKGQPRHLLLVDPEGKVRTKDRVFSSVQELIAYHVEDNLPIISSGSQVTISNPVHKH